MQNIFYIHLQSLFFLNYPFYISEYAEKTEIGKMEMGRNLLIGDHGTITAEGYTKRARFIIQARAKKDM